MIEGNDPAILGFQYSRVYLLFGTFRSTQTAGRNVGDFFITKTGDSRISFGLERVISTKGARNQCGSEKYVISNDFEKLVSLTACGRGYIYGSENSRDFYEQIKNFTNTYFICRRISEENRKPTEFREQFYF